MAIDPQAQQNINDFQLYVQDTLMSISTKFSENMKDAIEDAFDGLDKKVIASVEKDLTKTFKNLIKYSDDVAINSLKISQGLTKSKDISKQLQGIDEKRALLEAKINHAKALGVKMDDEDIAKLKESLEYQEKELKLQKQVVDQLNKNVGITGTLLKSAEKVANKLGLSGIDDVFKEAKKASSETATNLMTSEKTSSNITIQTRAMAAGFSSLAKGIGKQLLDPLVLITAQIAIFKKLFDLAKGLDQTLVDNSRALGVSKEVSKDLYNSASQYASVSGTSFLNATRLLESQQKLNKELGTAVNFGNQEADSFYRLTTFYGLSEQSSAKLFQFSKQQGKTTQDTFSTLAKTYTLQRAQLGGTMSYSKLLDNVANVSSDIYVNFKGNTEAIAKAVMQADRLGLSLEKTQEIGESLLNFESSIENELKAELLTGKAINLEKAREYALSGDTAKLTQEIAKQVGNIHNFEQMNVIQRKAYAEAFGMSVKEMSEMLRKQEFEAKLTKEAKESATATLKYAKDHNIQIDEALKQQYEQRSLAEQQKDVFAKLNELLTKLTTGPMRAFLGMLEKSLGFAQKIINELNSISGGTLGNALGAAIIGAPMLLMAVRGLTGLLSGGLKSMFFQRGTYPNPMIVRDISGGIGGGGGGGIMDMITGGGGFGGKKNLVKRFGSAGAARTAMRGFRGGAITAGIGIGADLIAGQMDEGPGKDVVSGIGTTAEFAGTGAMIGSVIPGIGTAVGAIVGGGIGLIKSFFDAEDKRKERDEKAKKEKEEREKKTAELLEQFASRPVQLSVGGKTILDFNTAQNLYGTNQSSFS